jgi:hypothetical protein
VKEAHLRALHYAASFAVLLFATAAQSTWKPEYAKNPSAVTQWFKEARVKGKCDQTGRAWMELGICGCCELADRLRTKFVGEKGKEWS